MINFNEEDYIQRELDKISENLMAKNYEALEEFEGISPAQMHGLLHFPFDKNKSIIHIHHDISNESLTNSKFFQDIKYFLSKILSEQPLKLTNTGKLPRKFCQNIVDVGIENDWWFEKHKIRTERDSYVIHLLNIISKVSGLIRKRKNKLYLTKKAEIYIKKNKDSDFFLYILQCFTKKYNWAYMDGYAESWIIQSGFGFTLYLLHRYGETERNIEFYADKFYQAFPNGLEDFSKVQEKDPLGRFKRCYKVRTFDRFLKHFGFVDIMGKDKYTSITQTTKRTELFERYFSF